AEHRLARRAGAPPGSGRRGRSRWRRGPAARSPSLHFVATGWYVTPYPGRSWPGCPCGSGRCPSRQSGVSKPPLDLLRAHLESELLEDSLRRLRSAAESVPARQLWETGSLRNAAVNRRESLKERLTVIGLGLEQIQALLTDQKLVEAVPLRSPIDGVVVHFDKVLGQALTA